MENDSIKMPVLFLGHGNPMNAIQENEFVEGFRKISAEISRPKSILCISAHWETRGTKLTAMENPPTIHDFGGFPQALFDVQYPAPGNPELAQNIKSKVHYAPVEADYQWGLDHGAWSVIKHLYPKADVPVIEMSLDVNQNPQNHYNLAKELAFLRKSGVLIIGSGNLVHNLGMVAWNRLNNEEYGYDWAFEANNKLKNLIRHNNHQSLINYNSQGKELQLSIPTPEHFLPLLYVLALKEEKDEIQFFNDKVIGGSLSMISLRVG